MSETELQELFATWWKESFPMAPANKQAAASHVAFAAYVLDTFEVIQQYRQVESA
jgi:hypothetical protein